MASRCSTTTGDRLGLTQHMSYADLLGECRLSSSSSSSGDADGSSAGDDSSSQDSDSEMLDVVGSKEGDTQASLVTTTTRGSGDGGDERIPDRHDESSDDSDNETAADLSRPNSVPQVTLINKGDFLPTMEVQISPQGRLIQPVPTVRFANLLDDLQYAVWISFVQECGVVAGDYMHPDAPLPGSHWNKRVVAFSRLRLFTFDGFNKTPISLVCNKKYFLQINYGIVNDVGHIVAHTVMRKGIVGTWFVAVNYHKKSSSSKKSKRSSSSKRPRLD